MPEMLIHIARGEAELGAFSLEEARELLDAGFLKLSDDAWTPGMPQWGPLGQTLSCLSAPGPHADWRDKVVAGSTALSGLIGQRMGKFVAGVKAYASDAQKPLSPARRLGLEQYLPQFQKLLAQNLQGKPAAVVRAAMQDEELSRKLFGALYDCLPTPLRRFVPETVFVSFCLEHRQKLFSRTAPLSTSNSTE